MFAWLYSAKEALRSCVDNLTCTSSDQQFEYYQEAVGIANGDEYLCSAAARPGTHNNSYIHTVNH